jgi:hypothetical protein
MRPVDVEIGDVLHLVDTGEACRVKDIGSTRLQKGELALLFRVVFDKSKARQWLPPRRFKECSTSDDHA